jgi:superfamily II DNA helicase RecQ
MNDQQVEVVNACENNKDVVVIMPTGGGKSGCFFVPGL